MYSKWRNSAMFRNLRFFQQTRIGFFGPLLFLFLVFLMHVSSTRNLKNIQQRVNKFSTPITNTLKLFILVNDVFLHCACAVSGLGADRRGRVALSGQSVHLPHEERAPPPPVAVAGCRRGREEAGRRRQQVHVRVQPRSAAARVRRDGRIVRTRAPARISAALHARC